MENIFSLLNPPYAIKLTLPHYLTSNSSPFQYVAMVVQTVTMAK